MKYKIDIEVIDMYLIIGFFILLIAFGNRIIIDGIKYKFNLLIVAGKPILENSTKRNNNNIKRKIFS
tara:strand:+ start:207 stop:407 length:201 start_codon:yes stop_codon:yes gene_type:complete